MIRSEPPLPGANESAAASSGLSLEIVEGGGDTESPREALKDGFFISATEGNGLRELQLKIQKEVLRATKQKFFKIVIPADGQQLRYARILVGT